MTPATGDGGKEKPRRIVRPGDEFQMRDKANYRVDKSGAFRRIDPPRPSKKARSRAKRDFRKNGQ